MEIVIRMPPDGAAHQPPPESASAGAARGCQGDCQGRGQCCQDGTAMPTSQCFDDPSASFCCPAGCSAKTCRSRPPATDSRRRDGSPQLRFGLDLLSSKTNASATTRLAINVSHARADGSRIGNLTLTGSRRNATGHVVRAGWLMRPSESTVDLRVLIDRSIVEVFAAGGRAVATARDYPMEDDVGAYVWAAAGSEEVTFQTISAWSMGCGWEE